MDFKSETIKELAILKENNGYVKSLKLISWNYYPPKLDLREWTPDGHPTGKGFTMTDEEGLRLLNGLKEYYKDKEENNINKEDGVIF